MGVNFLSFMVELWKSWEEGVSKMSYKDNIAEELEKAPIGKLLFKLALPMVVAQVVNLLYNVVDRIYIGHMPDVGSTALTGVGICFPIICLINAFAMLIGQGGAPRSSIAMGNGNNKEAERILGNCVTSLVVVAIGLTVLIQIFGKDMLMLFGASENTIIYGLPYMRIYAFGSIFVLLSLGLNLSITAQGFTRFSMINVLVGAIVNIILDPILIFGFDMGVTGAAIATIFSQAVSAAMVLRFLTGKKTILRIRRENLRVSRKVLLPILALGIAPFIMQATEAILSISFNYSLQKYGGDIAVGAMTIATTVLQMIWIPANGIGQGAQPIISYNYGAGNVQRVKKAVRLMMFAICIYMVSFWAVVELFPQIFIRLFSNGSSELMETTTWTLRVYMASMGLFGIQTTVQQTFIATGQAKASLFIACLRKVILLIPCIFILPNFFENKVFAVFLAEPVSDFISVTVAGIIFLIIFPKMMQRLAEKSGQ